MEDIGGLIGQYGFPIIAAMGLGYFIFFIWQWVTTVIDPVIGQAQGVLIGLIDRIRMLDNDLIRLNQKLNVVLTLREQQVNNEKTIEELQHIIKDAGLNIDEHEKLHSIEDLKKIYKEEKNK
jgi:tetrahydromethanopterin S-methyltransferase subunit E|tara:strand:- start:574 stop:939 length:366 start_codon:yes stop_codon:yes gene_type:complete